MKSRLSYLLAARQCEISELEQLARTSELVGGVARFAHALQRERGISNIFLGSQGQRFADLLPQQLAECRALEGEVRAAFDQLDTQAGSLRNGARLFNRIAVVLHALDGLPALRAAAAARTISPRDAAAAYKRLIAGLLGVVFEAADSATDPQVSRALVAMFNFMQGKEFAGQERAFGGMVFASGQVDAPSQQQWQHLIELQQGCFQLFAEFAGPAVLAAERASVDVRCLAELERLRRIGCTLVADGRLDTGLAQIWYDCCTRRIDIMRQVEEDIARHLRTLCGQRIAQAQDELRDQRAILDTLAAQAQAEADVPAPHGPQIERSILVMVQDQARRLQAMSDELAAVRATLNERKVVERAKGLLMAHRQLSEADAYKALRQMAMNQNRRLVDVAESVLAMAAVLPAAKPR